jgi:site-specific recombinase XerD
METGTPVRKGYMADTIKVYLEKSKLRKKLNPHSFRYACATHMMKNGADIRYVQEMLGHEKLSTTQGYTKVVKGDLKRILRRFHPRELEEAVK